MKIIHTSDWHLGQHFMGKSRQAEHQQFLQWLINTAVAQQVNAIIVAGDIFDTGAPPSYARELYNRFIVNLQATCIHMIINTKNLSGGESFLVSLALALALYDLVRRKTRIDSLFLDEGFGTLDRETLDIALDALDNLNASGKMISVISHINALKERIPVQIEIKKISGLSVSKLDNKFRIS